VRVFKRIEERGRKERKGRGISKRGPARSFRRKEVFKTLFARIRDGYCDEPPLLPGESTMSG